MSALCAEPREGGRGYARRNETKRKGRLMKLNLKQILGLAVAGCLGLACSAFAAGHGNGPGNSMGASHGNSSFGMSQRTDLRTGSGNSSFGRTTSENARLKSDDADVQDEDDVPRTK